jgi:hypothetical protein
MKGFFNAMFSKNSNFAKLVRFTSFFFNRVTKAYFFPIKTTLFRLILTDTHFSHETSHKRTHTKTYIT